MRRAAKVDANHRAIVAALRAYGCSVQSLAAVGAGVPDLVVGLGGQNYLVEVKDGRKVKSARQLTPAQVRWREAWKGSVVVLETLEDVKACLRAWRTYRFVVEYPKSLPEFDASDYERPARVTPNMRPSRGGIPRGPEMNEEMP